MTGLLILILGQTTVQNNTLAYSQWVMNAAMIGWQAWLTHRVRSNENLKAEVKLQTKELAQAALEKLQIEVLAEQEKLRTEFLAEFRVYTGEINQINKRLESGDAGFDGIDKREREADMRLNQRFEELHKHISQHCASRSDFRELEGKVTGIQCDIAAMKASKQQ